MNLHSSVFTIAEGGGSPDAPRCWRGKNRTAHRELLLGCEEGQGPDTGHRWVNLGDMMPRERGPSWKATECRLRLYRRPKNMWFKGKRLPQSIRDSLLLCTVSSTPKAS